MSYSLNGNSYTIYPFWPCIQSVSLKLTRDITRSYRFPYRVDYIFILISEEFRVSHRLVVLGDKPIVVEPSPWLSL